MSEELFKMTHIDLSRTREEQFRYNSTRDAGRFRWEVEGVFSDAEINVIVYCMAQVKALPGPFHTTRVRFAKQDFHEDILGTSENVNMEFSVVERRTLYSPPLLKCSHSRIPAKTIQENDRDTDIVLSVNVKWCTDLGSDPKSDEFDMATVLLHELCHYLWHQTPDYIVTSEWSKSALYFHNTRFYRTLGHGFYCPRWFEFVEVETTNPNVPWVNLMTFRDMPRKFYKAICNGNVRFSAPDYNVTVPVYSPEDYLRGSSLYHFDRDPDYELMWPTIEPGQKCREYNAQIRKIFEILQDYETKTSPISKENESLMPKERGPASSHMICKYKL